VSLLRPLVVAALAGVAKLGHAQDWGGSAVIPNPTKRPETAAKASKEVKWMQRSTAISRTQIQLW